MKIKLTDEINRIISLLAGRGISAYPVGGCVRDFVLGNEPNDFDLCAEATPGELEAALQDEKTVNVGIEFGTVRVLLNDNTVTEITCCRSDGAYRDCRKPESVLYNKSLGDDLARRDFTVNAMAYSEKDGIIDAFGGIEDCRRKIIRCVGNPNTRFSEDALRILRALRFSSVLGFEIEEKTAEAIHNLKGLLKNISAERIFTELKKLLCGKNVYNILIDFSDVICEFIPELAPAVGFEQKSIYHIYTVYDHIAHSVEIIKPEETLRLAMLFHDIGKPYSYQADGEHLHFRGHPEKSAEIAEDILKRLKCNNKTRETVVSLVRYHDLRPLPEKKSVKRYVARVGKETGRMLCLVRAADVLSQSGKTMGEIPKIEKTEKIIEELEKEKACLSVSELEINGDDIIKTGVAPGPQVGEILRELLEAVIDERVPNEKAKLIDYIINK